MRRLLLIPLLLAGCSNPHRVRPKTPLQVKGEEVDVSVAWVEPDSSGHGGPTVVGVRVRNHGPRKLYFDVKQAGLADLRPQRPTSQPSSQPTSRPSSQAASQPAATQPVSSPDPSAQLGNPVRGVVGAGVAGAKVGRGLSGPGGGTGLGAVAGAGIGVAAGIALMLPVGIALAIQHGVAEARKHLDPGEQAVIPLQISDVDLVDYRSYGLVLHRALQQRAEDLPPLPIVWPGAPHFGYDEPDDMRWIVVARMGGGPLLGRTDDDDGAMGGIGLFFGPQFHRLSLGIGGTLMGAGSLGAELRYDVPVIRWLSLVPFVGYGYYWLVGGPGFNVGHGPLGGLEINISMESSRLFNWPVRDAHVGLYVQAGPVFLFEGQSPATQVQAGLLFAIY